MKGKIKTIAVVGIGLMGGSLAAAIRRKMPRVRVIGVSRNRAALRHALKKRWIHEAFRDLEPGVRDADLVVVCAPVDAMKTLLVRIDAAVRKGTLVTDVGSVKGGLPGAEAAKRFKKILFVGAHPMTGSHERGVGAVRENLYDRSYTFLVRNPAIPGTAYRTVKTFWEIISPKVIEIGEQSHDRVVAGISHLPHAVAVCLMLSVPATSLPFAATGFADTTRIAQSDPSIWLPIFSANRRSLGHILKKFESQFKRFREALKHNNHAVLRGMITRAGKRRRQISF
jgi:prephenate dehydrogenase